VVAAPAGENVVVEAAALRRFCEEAFERAGVPADDAATVADTLVEADLRGVHSHGVWWMTTYTRRLRQGGLNPRPAVRALRETPCLAVLDADRAMGQVAGVRGMKLATEKAGTAGVGVVTVRNSNHLGAAAYYALLAARKNQIGFAVSDAEPVMAPWGGAKAVIGNNPMAYAIPVDGEFSIVLDMAQSVVAWGKIFLAAQRGEKIPVTWALNAEGAPTDDPHEAMVGLLLPVGGYKGYGLALVMEILGSVLAGATFGSDMAPMSHDAAPQDVGHFFMALDINQFLPLEIFRERIGRLVKEHRGVPRRTGIERIYLPGEIEHELRARRLSDGIPLEPYIIKALIALGEELDVEFPPPLAGRG
jgi:LDH2 family malate/lactate/ureidoglycolate dehydrogenase